MVEHNLLFHIKSLWPIGLGIAGFLIALFVAMRYKLPALILRVDKMEKKAANAVDLDRAITDFRTVCRFNQVSCQREMEHKWGQLAKEHDKKMAGLYERLNQLMVENGKLVAKVEILIKDHISKNNFN